MTLKLYYHPLSSYCHKALIALYESGVAFEPVFINLGDPESRAKLLKIWPIGKFPVLVDESRDHTVPEGTIIIEYLAQHYPGPSKLVPADPDRAWQTRMRDRFFDLYVNTQIGKIVGDRLRPEGQRDPLGVEQAKAQIETALDMIEHDMAAKIWAMGDDFTMADCAAAPSLFYADMIAPFARTRRNTLAYLERLKARPSFARVLKEAEPYLSMVPK